jgi:hypothetical protein
VPAEQRFSDLVGAVTVGDVKDTSTLQVPFIVWGGDMATFYANGGLKTQPGTLFEKQGLNLELVPGDDFIGQVRNYLEGKSPFLRGTFRMMGMASEVICSDPRTKGVVILQMTWSAGDHLVVRQGVKDLSDLKGKTIAVQQGGPHVGMVDDILKTAQLSWDDVKIKWAKDLTGTPESPAEMLRTDPSVDGCCVITPDLIGLCGGPQNVGTGAEGTVQGARMLVSTAEMSRSIADVYVCRKDFYDAHKDIVTKFVAGYLKACEEVVDLEKEYESKGSAEYMKLLQMTQDIYGEEVIPTLEEDAHGLLADCSFVGYPGNIKFFTDEKSLSGFSAYQEKALELATSRGYAKVRCGLIPSDLNYKSDAFLGYLTKTDVTVEERIDAEAALEEIEELSQMGGLDEKTIYSFTINFEPNQNTFSADQYGVEYQRVVEAADRFGNAVVAIRGHSDPTKTLLELVKAGMNKGILKKTGAAGDFSYSLQGKPLDLTQTEEMVRQIEQGAFDGVPEHNPRETMQAALNLSRRRAESVRDSIIEYAKGKGLELDSSQIQPVGVGIREPFIAKPSSMDEAKQNMRVEFRLIRVPAEVIKESDFDF